MLMIALTIAMIACAMYDTVAAGMKIFKFWNLFKEHQIDLKGLYIKLILNLLVTIPLTEYLKILLQGVK